MQNRRRTTKRGARMIRHRRVRAMVQGTAERPRLCVFRSAKHIAVQVIDDVHGRTLVAVSDRDVSTVIPSDGTHKVVLARSVGSMVAERAKSKGITAVVFDRGGYAYHGRVQAVADGARDGGLQF